MFTSFTPFPVKQSSTPLHPTLNFLQTKQCPSQTTNLVLIPLHLVPTFVPQVQQMYFLLHDWLLLCSSENYYSHEAWWGFVVKVVTIVRNLTVGFFFLLLHLSTPWTKPTINRGAQRNCFCWSSYIQNWSLWTFCSSFFWTVKCGSGERNC